MEHGGVAADIVCLGKGLNAGYLPISGVLVSDAVHGTLRNGSGHFPLGHTHSNHPVAAAAANAVLDVIEDEGLVERAAEVGARIGTRLAALAHEHAIVGDVRGVGMLWGLELVRDDVGFAPFDPSLAAAERVVAAAFDLGLLLYPSAGFAADRGGDAVIFAPPLNAADADIEEAVRLLDTALAHAAKSLTQRKEMHDAA